MKIDKNGNLKLNMIEKILAHKKTPYILTASLTFGIIYFYFVNLFLPTAFSSKIVSLILVPMLVGNCIGICFTKFVEFKLEDRKK